MKRIIYIFIALAATAMTACNNPKIDEDLVAMESFMDNQEVPGLYRKSKVEFAFDESKHQCCLNPSQLTYRIMDEGGDKFLQFKLSATPVEGEKVDVEATSYGLGLSSSASYKNLTVDRIENNRCYLLSDANGGYIGIIIDWIAE